MNMRDTRNEILKVSLDLFAKSGYSAVSIRDICKDVKIKESSVYYHFQSKRAILDELLYRFEKEAAQVMEKLEKALAEPVEQTRGNFYETACHCFFEEYLMDDFCNKMMRLLLIEQFGNREIRELYHLWMYHKPLSFQAQVFSLLTGMGFIKDTDSEYLAVQYYAPIYCYAQRWLLSGELTDEAKDTFRYHAYEHVEKFFAKSMA